MEKSQDWNKDKLTHFLETAPLYMSIEFTGKHIPYYDDLEKSIPEVSGYCTNCKTDRLFHIKNDPSEKLVSLNRLAYASSHDLAPSSRNPKQGFLSFDFYCTKDGCDLEKRFFLHYAHEEIVDENNVLISHVKLTKCGEYPSLPPRVDKAILNVFPDDAELLQKAIKCLKSGFGVGAFAYLRQVLEDRIDVFVDVIRKNAEEQGDKEALQKLDQLQDNSPESKKIAIAKKALPSVLQLNGINLLELLYKT